MTTLKLKAYVNRTRQLTLELPGDFPVGEVDVTIRMPVQMFIAPDQQPWSSGELDTMLAFVPAAARDIKTGAWTQNGFASDAFDPAWDG